MAQELSLDKMIALSFVPLSVRLLFVPHSHIQKNVTINQCNKVQETLTDSAIITVFPLIRTPGRYAKHQGGVFISNLKEKKIFLCPPDKIWGAYQTRSGGHIVFALSVCHVVCLFEEDFNIGHNF